jgi:hypothetical protein
MLEQMTKEFWLSKETAEVAVKNWIYVKEISNWNFELLSNYNGVVFSKGGDLQNAKNYWGRVSFSKASPNDRLWFWIQWNFFVVVDESTKDQMTIKLDK